MYYELSDVEYEMLKKVSSITNTDYELKGNFIPIDSLVNALDDMLVEYNQKLEEIEDMERDIEDNYRPVSLKEQYGICEVEYL